MGLHLKCPWLPWQGKGARRLWFWLLNSFAWKSYMLTAHWPKIAQCHCLYGKGFSSQDGLQGLQSSPNTPHPQPQQLIVEVVEGLSSLLVTLSCIMWSSDPFIRSSWHMFFRNSSWGEAWTSWKTDILPIFQKKWVSHNLYDSLSVWTKKKLTAKFSSHLQSLCQLRNLVEFLFLLLYYKGFLSFKIMS